MTLTLKPREKVSGAVSSEVRRPENGGLFIRWGYAAWLAVIVVFAALHALHLRADFPNGSPWYMDWAKYTDEGWYGNAAIRAHLFGNWYVPGDFNPAVAVPVWQFLEWLLFFFTGVTPQAARALAVAMFFVNLLLSYLLLGTSGPRWRALLVLTLMTTSPFLYCFGRLAILEPLLTAFLLAALNLAVRLKRLRRPVPAAVGVGLFFALAMLTKTTAVFLLPAVVWAVVLPLWRSRKKAIICVLAAGTALASSYGLWLLLIAGRGFFTDFKYYFFVNNYPRPKEFYWPLVSLWWSFHGSLWIDKILVPLVGIIILAALLFWRDNHSRTLLLDPLFGSSILAVAGCILFMTYQNHPQPRYFAVAAVFFFYLIAMGAEAWLRSAGQGAATHWFPARILGSLALGLAVLAAGLGGAETLRYAMHPEYTYVNAAAQLTHYIDTHPNGKRLLLSISGDQITLLTHLPSICDDFGTLDLPDKLSLYRPGWYAFWNDIDPGTLEDLHTHFSIEQVATFPALDDPERNLLVLFKLHPLPGGQLRDPQEQNLQAAQPGDSFDVPIE